MKQRKLYVEHVFTRLAIQREETKKKEKKLCRRTPSRPVCACGLFVLNERTSRGKGEREEKKPARAREREKKEHGRDDNADDVQ